MSGLFAQLSAWLFPRTCELCGGEGDDGSYLCGECESQFLKPERPLCFYCGEPVKGAAAGHEDCPHCGDRKHYFDFARACYINEGGARDLVLKLKYGHKIYLGRTLGARMSGLWEEYGDVLHSNNWVLVPVPLHPSKRCKRGYNQAEELAVALGKSRGIPVCRALTRKKDAQSQTKLSRKAREVHVRSLYSVKPKMVKNGSLEGKQVLLIDDVLTTGSTAEVCAKELRKAGVAKIGVLTVLRSLMIYNGKQT